MMMKMKCLSKTLAKNPNFRLSALFLSTNSWTTISKLPPQKSMQPQNHPAAEITEEGNPKIDGKMTNNWPKPSEIPIQSKVANWVNFIGSIRMPVQFVTSADGKSWAGTVVSQDHNSSDLRLLWIPIIFEGDLAHTAATHLKILDTVHVAGHLTQEPLPINLTNDRVDIQVKVHDIHFVRGYHNMKKYIRK